MSKQSYEGGLAEASFCEAHGNYHLVYFQHLQNL